MTLSKVIAMIRARWWLVMAVMVLTTATAIGVSLYLPKKYLATASLVVDVKPDPISAVMYPGLSSPTFINTQVDVLRSERVAYRVAQDLQLAADPEMQERWQLATQGEGTIEQWLAASLQSGLTVAPSKESNVLRVSYSATDPEHAAKMANAFVRAYLAVSLDLRVDPARRYSSYFDEQVKVARQELEAAQAKLSAFQRQNGIIGNDERFDVENARLNDLSSQLVVLQALSAESESRQRQAAGASADRLQEVLNNPLVSQLRSELSRAENRMRELDTRYGPSHPQVIEAKASIGELRSRLEIEMRRVSGGAAVSNTINRQREAEIRAALEAQRAKVLRLKAVRDDAALLAREVDNKHRAYDGIATRLTQSNLESQSTLNNINLLNEATQPVNPASPNIRLNAALALVVGVAIGLGLALLLELGDRRVRDVDDVAMAMQLPVLGVLKAPSRRNERGRLRAMEDRVLGSHGLGPNKRIA